MLLFLSNSKFSFSFAADLKSIPEHHQRRRCLFVGRSWTNGFAALCEGARLISPSLIVAKKKSEKPTCEPEREPWRPIGRVCRRRQAVRHRPITPVVKQKCVLINASRTGENANKLIRLPVNTMSVPRYYRHISAIRPFLFAQVSRESHLP